MLRIAHTADVHWRGLSRHDEYREVFEFFVKDCEKNKVDHIFVGGDIFHTKTTGISPEYIEQLTWWLSAMSSVAPVHLILGNHDGNLVNLSRQDAVSPIVSALNNKNIFLYKKSGCYEFSPGYVWNVFSPFDEENWNEVKPQPGKINIACFHGPIAGSVTEVGWNIDDNRTISFFDGYDFALLGDIHKQQYLAYRNKKPWIAYPGTPIQQNYAEDVDHGYLLWNITSKDEWSVDFKKLPNPKPYVTLSWSGSVDDLQKEANAFPKGSRFRIRSSEHISQKEVRQISNLLSAKFNATEVTHKSDVTIDRSVIKAGAASLAKEDLRSQDVLLRLVKENYKNSTISECMWRQVGDAIKSIISSAAITEEVVRNSKWSLRCLSFDNIFAYGEENFINFDQLNGIVGIFGPNRSGKSSIVGTIMYSLFNTTDRGPMKNIHICNVRKPYCSSKAVICHNGIDYVIERQTTKTENKKGVVTASTSLNLYKIREDGEADELNGEQRNDTEKTIRNLIGGIEDFLMTSLSAQGEINQFIMQGSTKRRSILSRFLDLDVFDKMHEIANKEANGIKYQLKNYPERNWNEVIENDEDALATADLNFKEIEQKILELQNDTLHWRNELHKHGNSILVTEDQLIFQAKKIASLVEAHSQCSSKISVLENEVSENLKKIKKIQDLKLENNLDELKKKRSVYKDLESSLATLRYSFEKEDVSLRQYQKSLNIE
jgi:DNA repair exonuclease SbcCD nuclease subunit